MSDKIDSIAQMPRVFGNLNFNLCSFTILGQTIWYIDDIRVRSYTHLQRITKCSDELIMILKLKYGEVFNG